MQLQIEPLPYLEALEESKAYFLFFLHICSQYYQYYWHWAILAPNDYISKHYNSCIYILQYTLLWKFPTGPNKNVSRIERCSGDWNIIIDTFEAHTETVRGIIWKMLILCIDTLQNNSNYNLPTPYIHYWSDGCLSR